MQYGHSVLRQFGTSAEQRYEDEDMYKSLGMFVQPRQVLIENMG